MHSEERAQKKHIRSHSSLQNSLNKKSIFYTTPLLNEEYSFLLIMYLVWIKKDLKFITIITMVDSRYESRVLQVTTQICCCLKVQI